MLLSDSPEPPFYTFRLDCHHCHTCQYRDFDLEQDWRSCDEFDPVRGKTKSAMRGMFFGKDCICFSRSIYSVRLIYWGVSWLQANRRGGGVPKTTTLKRLLFEKEKCVKTQPAASGWVSVHLFNPSLRDDSPPWQIWPTHLLGIKTSCPLSPQ